MIKGKDVRVSDLGPLTRREAETVLWIAEGKTAWEAGTIMGVSESTAVAHAKAAMTKLEASARPHLVARAFCAGILKAGTTIVLIVAILLRMPGTSYQKLYRPRVRRREDEVPELMAEAHASAAGGHGGLELPDITLSVLAIFDERQYLFVYRCPGMQAGPCVQVRAHDDRGPAGHWHLDGHGLTRAPRQQQHQQHHRRVPH